MALLVLLCLVGVVAWLVALDRSEVSAWGAEARAEPAPAAPVGERSEVDVLLLDDGAAATRARTEVLADVPVLRNGERLSLAARTLVVHGEDPEGRRGGPVEVELLELKGAPPTGRAAWEALQAGRLAASERSRDGRVELRDLEPGWFALRCGAPELPEALVFVEVLARPEGTGAEEVRVRLERPARVLGHVFDPSGRPAYGATAFLVSSTGSLEAAAADPEGRFVVHRLPSGPAVVVATGRLHAPSDARPLELAEGQRTDGVELRVRAPASVSGVVRDAEGRPAPGAAVEFVLAHADRAAVQGWPAVHTDALVREHFPWDTLCLTDDHGEFRLRAVPSGRGWVRAWYRKSERPIFGNAASVANAPLQAVLGAEASVELVLEPPAHTLVIEHAGGERLDGTLAVWARPLFEGPEIADARSAAVPRGSLHDVSLPEENARVRIVDGRGEIRIQAASHYRVEILSMPGEYWHVHALAVASGLDTSRVRIGFPRTRLELTVSAPDGAPVAGRAVLRRLSPGGGPDEPMPPGEWVVKQVVQLAWNGFGRTNYLVPGRYALTAEREVPAGANDARTIQLRGEVSVPNGNGTHARSVVLREVTRRFGAPTDTPRPQGTVEREALSAH